MSTSNQSEEGAVANHQSFRRITLPSVPAWVHAQFIHENWDPERWDAIVQSAANCRMRTRLHKHSKKTNHKSSKIAKHKNSKKTKHIYVGAIFVMYVSLIGLLQLKFQDGEVFNTATGVSFIIVSLASVAIAIATSGVLLYADDDDPFENTNMSRMRCCYVMLNFGFYFSTALAVISLVLVLFLPHKLHWVGYATIGVLFAFMVTYHLCLYKRLVNEEDVLNPVDMV